MDSAVLVAAIGVFSLTIAGLFKLIGDQNKSHEKMAESFDKVAKSNERIAKETKRGADEAKERNGHLAEITVQQGDRLAALMENIREQHVGKQIVDEQEVHSETVEKQVVKK